MILSEAIYVREIDEPPEAIAIQYIQSAVFGQNDAEQKDKQHTKKRTIKKDIPGFIIGTKCLSNDT